MALRIRKRPTFVIRQISPKIFQKNNPQVLVQKDASSPRMTEQIESLQCRLECIFR